MFSQEELDMVELCSNDMSLDAKERAHLTRLLDKCRLINQTEAPKIIVTISGGAFQYAFANRPIELCIEDLDNIREGDLLYYPALAGDDQEIFLEAIRKAEMNVVLCNARRNRGEPVTEARIFTSGSDFCIEVNRDIVSKHKTFEEAFNCLNDYLSERKV